MIVVIIISYRLIFIIFNSFDIKSFKIYYIWREYYICYFRLLYLYKYIWVKYKINDELIVFIFDLF